MSELFVYVDGGCLNNGLENAQGYGSFKITRPNPRNIVITRRFDLSAKTNNVAEYQAMICCLEYLQKYYLDDNIVIFSDSQLIINQITGTWKTKNTTMKELCKEANNLLKPYWKLQWISGTTMKKILGH